MKIGILTFWWSQDNYGQVLQCYALQKYLRDLGHDVFHIRYSSFKDVNHTPLFFRLLKAFNPILSFKYLHGKKNKLKVLYEQKKCNRYFEDFKKKYILFSGNEYSAFSDLKSNPPSADVYIVGSDQVWNYWNMRLWRYINPLHAYFLDFGSENVERI